MNLEELKNNINVKCQSIEKQFIDKGLFSLDKSVNNRFIISLVKYDDNVKSILFEVDLDCLKLAVQTELENKGELRKVPTWLLEKIKNDSTDYLIYFNSAKIVMYHQKRNYYISTDMFNIGKDWFTKIEDSKVTPVV